MAHGSVALTPQRCGLLTASCSCGSLHTTVIFERNTPRVAVAFLIAIRQMNGLLFVIKIRFVLKNSSGGVRRAESERRLSAHILAEWC